MYCTYYNSKYERPPKQDELAVPTLYSHETRLASISYPRCTVFLLLEHILEPKRTVNEINHFSQIRIQLIC